MSLPAAVVEAVKGTAERFRWWGYKLIAVICSCQGLSASNRQAYRVMKICCKSRCRRLTATFASASSDALRDHVQIPRWQLGDQGLTLTDGQETNPRA